MNQRPAARRGLRLLGHPLHPMLAGFPLALWAAAALWDVVGLLRPEPLWPRLALWTLILGSIAALPAAAAGLWDLVALPRDHPAERLGWWHMGAMSVAFCLFLGSLLVRWRSPGPPPSPAVALCLSGAAVALAGGWLGGDLVFRHGVAVEPRERR